MTSWERKKCVIIACLKAISFYPHNGLIILLEWKLIFLRNLKIKLYRLLAYSVNIENPKPLFPNSLCMIFSLTPFPGIFKYMVWIFIDFTRHFQELFNLETDLIQFWEMFFYYFFDNFHVNYFVLSFLLKILLNFGPRGFSILISLSLFNKLFLYLFVPVCDKFHCFYLSMNSYLFLNYFYNILFFNHGCKTLYLWWYQFINY